jgi:hypothetical protein
VIKTQGFLTVLLAVAGAAWLLALSALGAVGFWGVAAGVAFLILVGAGIVRAARI